ncbi:MAG: chemotaxis protein CheA [archaeon]
MDMSEYKQAFLFEAKEHIDSLNESLMLLEKAPDDTETINKAFRSFHTLKGNAGAMGYVKYSELAHALEDLLSRIRDHKLSISKNIMDLLFEGCDLLEEGLEEIKHDNPENINAENAIQELERILKKDEAVTTAPVGQELALSEPDKARIEELRKSNANIFRAIIVFEPGNQLRGAKSTLLLKNLRESSTIIKTTPEEDHIRTGKFETDIEVVLATNRNKEEMKNIVNHISGLKHVFMLELEEAYEKPAETKHEEKELAKKAITDQHQNELIKQIQSVRVDMQKLDRLVNLVGELLIGNIRLQDINKKQDYTNLKTTLSGLDRLILELQGEVMEIRMVPIGDIFTKFLRMVRDLAGKENKKISMAIEGAEIKFDRTVLDELGDPLVHLLRNCVDHGIELPEERIRLGKPEEGTINLIARREKNNAVIQIIDDGAGIDPQIIKQLAISKGKVSEMEAAKMSDHELQMLIFKADMSTNKIVTEVSGRGVGMDVVMTKTRELGGSVALESEPGKGTTVTMQLPLTIAIISVLLVKAKDDIYAIPLNLIDQTVDIHRSDIKTIRGHELFLLRGQEIPLFWLRELVGTGEFVKPDKITVVVVSKDSQRIGIAIDTIVSQQQILIKSLQEIVKGVRGCSGATILGDGRVALILDIATLI